MPPLFQIHQRHGPAWTAVYNLTLVLVAVGMADFVITVYGMMYPKKSD